MALEYPPDDGNKHALTRRDLLKVMGGAAFVQAPAVVTQSRTSSAGRRFRAYVRHDATSSLMDLTLRPIHPRQVLLRVQAGQACHTIVDAITNAPVTAPVIVGHGADGIVEEVGSQVKRVQVGDRVVVAVTSQCGQCYNCLLSLLSCVATTGLGMAMMRVPVEPGSDVVVLGAGPVGLSAVQGARIVGAAQIIVVEPIRARRDLAMKMDATTVLDPNAEGDGLVNTIKDMCKGPTDRTFAGGRDWVNPNNKGPDFVIEAVGGDRTRPVVEQGPDATGVLSLQQAWQLCRAGGWIRTSGVGHPPGATVTFPAGAWSNATKNQAGGNFAGVQTLRDIPRFARLIETKQFDARSLVGRTFPLAQAREAPQATADRTTISSVVTIG